MNSTVGKSASRAFQKHILCWGFVRYWSRYGDVVEPRFLQPRVVSSYILVTKSDPGPNSDPVKKWIWGRAILLDPPRNESFMESGYDRTRLENTKWGLGKKTIPLKTEGFTERGANTGSGGPLMLYCTTNNRALNNCAVLFASLETRTHNPTPPTLRKGTLQMYYQ